MFAGVSLGVHDDKNKTKVHWLFSKWYNVHLFFQIIVFHFFVLTYELIHKNISKNYQVFKIENNSLIFITLHSILPFLQVQFTQQYSGNVFFQLKFMIH